MIPEHYNTMVNVTHVMEKVERLSSQSEGMREKVLLNHIFSMIDLTSLNPTDDVLGNEWLKPERFRFGTSKLANLLLGEIYF